MQSMQILCNKAREGKSLRVIDSEIHLVSEQKTVLYQQSLQCTYRDMTFLFLINILLFTHGRTALILSVFNVFYMSYFLSRLFRVTKRPKNHIQLIILDNPKIFAALLLPRTCPAFPLYQSISFYLTEWKYIIAFANQFELLCASNASFSFFITPPGCLLYRNFYQK